MVLEKMLEVEQKAAVRKDSAEAYANMMRQVEAPVGEVVGRLVEPVEVV
jgi:hypothetical protein